MKSIEKQVYNNLKTEIAFNVINRKLIVELRSYMKYSLLTFFHALSILLLTQQKQYSLKTGIYLDTSVHYVQKTACIITNRLF